MNRPTMETRDSETSQNRVVVMDWSVAKWALSILGAALFAAIGVGLWVGTTVTDHGGRIKSLEEKKEDIDENIARLEERVRPLELSVQSTANSAAFQRDLMDTINQKMDQLDTKVDRLLEDNSKAARP